MNIMIKKLWHGNASVRDYYLKKCIDGNEDLVIEYCGEKMTIRNYEIKKTMFQTHDICFKGKYSANNNYRLVDFKWNPDTSNAFS